MLKKYIWLIIIVIVIIAAAIGGYFATQTNSTKASKTSTVAASILPINNSVVLTKTKASIGQYLTDLKGNTLYTYSKDTPNVSNCVTSCLAIWPPYIDKGSTTNLPANFGVIKRSDDNEYQYTFKGMPLYYYVNDSPGQVTGNGVAGFNVARP